MKKIMFQDKYSLTKAVLDGSKTQTRRVIKPEPITARHWNPKAFGTDNLYYRDGRGLCQLLDKNGMVIKPKYMVGEIVAIAQSYEVIDNEFPHAMIYSKLYDALQLDKSNGVAPLNQAGWNNKMFVKADLMPHQIKITGVRVERLQDISDEDCIKEGVEKVMVYEKVWSEKPIARYKANVYKYLLDNTPREAFRNLINAVSGKGTWESNPFVWVYEFELLK